MATITKKKLADGSLSYKADIRIKRKGIIVHRESRSFSRKKLAADWAARREVELQAPGVIESAVYHKTTLADLITRYIKEYNEINQFGRSKLADLTRLESCELAKMPAVDIRSMHIIEHVRDRLAGGTGTATVLNDIVWLRTVFKVARPAWGVPVSLTDLDDASNFCYANKLISRSTARDRRPTLEELDKLLEYFADRDQRSDVQMVSFMLFQLFSGRRDAETCRLKWDTLDEEEQTILVTDMKHPRIKLGNNVTVHLPDHAFTVLKKQSKENELVFPYNPKTTSTNFTKACKFLEIEDLRLHDLRHECASHLFELGWDIPRVAQVTGHKSWSALQRYTHLRGVKSFDKYKDWKGLKYLYI